MACDGFMVIIDRGASALSRHYHLDIRAGKEGKRAGQQLGHYPRGTAHQLLPSEMGFKVLWPALDRIGEQQGVLPGIQTGANFLCMLTAGRELTSRKD